MSTTVVIDAAPPSGADGLLQPAQQTPSDAPPLTRFAAIALPMVYLGAAVTSYGSSILATFAMVPVNTFLQHVYFWNLATHPFVETSLPLLLVNLGVIVTVVRPHERDFGTPALMSVWLATAIIVAIMLVLLTPMLSALFGAPLASVAYGGFLPLSIATVIAAWQRNPEAVSVNFGVAAVRTANMPLMLTLVAFVVDLVVGDGLPQEEEISAGIVPTGSATLSAVLALHGAWWYLRFAANGGDSSAAFAYHELFPGPLKVLAKAVGQFFWIFGRCCGVREATGAAATAAASDTAVQPKTALTPREPRAVVANSVADRRRQLALAALSQRLDKARQLEQQQTFPDVAPPAPVAQTPAL